MGLSDVSGNHNVGVHTMFVTMSGDFIGDIIGDARRYHCGCQAVSYPISLEVPGNFIAGLHDISFWVSSHTCLALFMMCLIWANFIEISTG